MGNLAWELPWRGKHVPHAAIDVLRNCNITCRACYNTKANPPPKTLPQIEGELDELLRLRRLSSISILGGEVSMHPELYAIVRSIRARGLHVELITNGLEIDAPMCSRLRQAGLDVIYFHIERGQVRPDLPAPHTADCLNRLRREKSTIAAQAGLDVGLTMTAYPGELDDVRDILSFTLDSPEINYLLITLFREGGAVASVQGSLHEGLTGCGTPQPEAQRHNNGAFAQWVLDEFGFEPFAYMGSNLDRHDPRWLSYLIGTVYDEGGGHYAAHVRPSLLEKGAVAWSRLAKGRYPMYLEQDADRFRSQLALNGWLGGRRAANRELVRRARAPGARLTAKRILFQNPAQLSADGKLVHCRWCPDAVLKNGALVPVCIADRRP